MSTKSSTETKIIGVNDAMPHVLWTSYFLEGQGYQMQSTKLYQDNLSAIINNGEIDLEYYGKEDMMADFFTKPLQGALFCNFRAIIKNLDG
eukprot:14886781-Ditylum_brightwellii.AAC.1